MNRSDSSDPICVILNVCMYYENVVCGENCNKIRPWLWEEVLRAGLVSVWNGWMRVVDSVTNKSGCSIGEKSRPSEVTKFV